MMYTIAIITAVFSFYIQLDAVPPEACFANFRWENCGGPPTRVLYYWKPGSRCEVGIWRGCLPNLNMFNDEYECVSTCIFGSRARASDYHQVNSDEDIEITTEVESTTGTDFDSTTVGNATGNTEEGKSTTVVDGDSNSTSSDTNSTTKA